MVLGVQFMATPLIIGLIQISFSLDEKETINQVKSKAIHYAAPTTHHDLTWLDFFKLQNFRYIFSFLLIDKEQLLNKAIKTTVKGVQAMTVV